MRTATAAVGLWFLVVPGTAADSEPIPGIGPAGEIQRLATGFVFAEGPAADARGVLYFSEIGRDRILRFDPPDTVSTVIADVARTNGLMFAHDGRLYACDAGLFGRKGVGRVIAVDLQTTQVDVVADGHRNQPFNRLNDLVIDRTGGVYFTDALEGLPNLPQDAAGVYYVSGKGDVTRLIQNLERPNGLILSPDESTLYVVPAAAPVIMKYAVQMPGQIGKGTVFCRLPHEIDRRPYGADGLTVDTQGNLYIAMPAYNAIIVVTARGETLGRILFPESPVNCTFGGPDRNTLYVTAPNSLFSVLMESTGHRFAVAKVLPGP